MRKMDIDPTFMAYLNEATAAQPRPIREQDVAERRARMAQLRCGTAPALPRGIGRTRVAIELEDRSIPLRIIHPEGGGPFPAVLYYHGGGWMYGSPEQSEPNAIKVAAAVGAVVIMPEYRKSPEHPFPAAFNDCLAALRWAAEDYEAFRVDPQRLAVMGESSGGNLAAAVALAARDSGTPELLLQVLNYPALGTDFETNSYRDNADAPILNRDDMVYFWHHYLGGKEDTSEAYAAPLSAAGLSGAAPAFIMVAEYDPLRDDGINYAKRLRAAGVSVDFHHAMHLTHGLLRAWDVSDDARAMGDAMLSSLRAAFEQPTH